VTRRMTSHRAAQGARPARVGEAIIDTGNNRGQEDRNAAALSPSLMAISAALTGLCREVHGHYLNVNPMRKSQYWFAIA
jgi:hypothetical protein